MEKLYRIKEALEILGLNIGGTLKTAVLYRV